MREKEPTAFPETASAAEIGGFVGLSERTVQQLSQKGVLPKSTGRGQYPFRETVLAVVERERRAATGDDAQRSNDRARREKAEADSAEMAAAREKGLLMLTADAKRMWTDGFVKIRDVVQRSGLNAAQKKDLTEKMQQIKLEDDR